MQLEAIARFVAANQADRKEKEPEAKPKTIVQKRQFTKTQERIAKDLAELQSKVKRHLATGGTRHTQKPNSGLFRNGTAAVTR